MTTHTPGPWKLEEGIGGKDITGRELDGEVIVVAGNVYKNEDARLIAAAPELLAALMKWDEFMRNNYSERDITWWHETRAAIAKAANPE